MNGIVSGGWNYVWAAYGITVISFIIYGVILVTSLREEAFRSSKEQPTQ